MSVPIWTANWPRTEGMMYQFQMLFCGRSLDSCSTGYYFVSMNNKRWNCRITLAREMLKKHTLISIPLIVI